jgi:membrane protease YdiL (CAAX protease family)
MGTHTPEIVLPSRNRTWLLTIFVVLALAAFSAFFVLVDNAYLRFADARFPHVGTSSGLANLWGLVSRVHLLILIIPLVVWRPHLFRFQIGKIFHHWKLLLIMLLANCGVIAAYLLLSGSTTPYSGNQWLLTEIITVPLVEELFWRGLVYSLLLQALSKIHPENRSNHLTVWFSGLAFGLLHANNIFAGVPVQFVAIQSLNAAVWGVVYGYSRMKTDSIYPAIFLHAAMNLVVVLF